MAFPTSGLPRAESRGDTLPTLRGYTGSVREALDVEALSLRYGPMVLRRCRRLLRDEDEALDACSGRLRPLF